MNKGVQDFLNTYAGERLVKNYPDLKYKSVWRIKGEDPNCDMSGTHIRPLLDTVEGRLIDAIEYGIELDGFWLWGSGGDFEEVVIKTIDIDNVKLRKEKLQKIAFLKQQIAELEGQLEEL